MKKTIPLMIGLGSLLYFSPQLFYAVFLLFVISSVALFTQDWILREMVNIRDPNWMYAVLVSATIVTGAADFMKEALMIFDNVLGSYLFGLVPLVFLLGFQPWKYKA